MAKSDVAAWCRGMDCTLDGHIAIIQGWDEQFATISRLDGVSRHQWSWEAVDRIMRKGRAFKS